MQENKRPKCPIIGADGNIFSVMGTASKTLKHNGMTEESKEMCSRATSSGSYEEGSRNHYEVRRALFRDGNV